MTRPTERVELACNENPLGPSPMVISAAQAELGRIHRYPEAQASSLRQSLADHLRVSEDEVVVGNGASDLLELLVGTFCSGTQRAVFAEPSFVVYRLACLAHGVPFTEVALDGYVHDLSAMARAVSPGTRLVFIANPNNPTGTHVGRKALSAFLAAMPREVMVVLDEAYAEYADAPDFPDGLELRREHPNVVVVRTFSKIHGLAGLRLGYAVMQRELAEYVHRVRAPFSVSSVARAAGLAALRDRDHVERSRALNRSERAFLQQRLSGLGLRVVPSQANFLLVDMARPALGVYEALLAQGVVVRALSALRTMLRISVGTRAENERCVTALQAVLA
ncbi:MAG: Histidinol-phosphate transaminase [Pseudomonadota bacterium]|jgi:histidinol-phosphate aminotransferase